MDFVPSSSPELPAVTGFDLGNLSNLALLPAGTLPYKTRWGNLGAWIGLAYQVSESQRWQTVLRGGVGVFYDLASSEAGTGFPLGLATLLDQVPSLVAKLSFEQLPLQLRRQSRHPNASNGGSLLRLIRTSDRRTRSNGMLQWNRPWETANA